MDISGVICPREEISLRRLQVIPPLVPSQSVGVELGEEGWGDDLLHNCCDLVSCGPKIAEHDRVALSVSAHWVSLEVDVDCTGKSVSDD